MLSVGFVRALPRLTWFSEWMLSVENTNVILCADDAHRCFFDHTLRPHLRNRTDTNLFSHDLVSLRVYCCFGSAAWVGSGRRGAASAAAFCYSDDGKGRRSR